MCVCAAAAEPTPAVRKQNFTDAESAAKRVCKTMVRPFAEIGLRWLLLSTSVMRVVKLAGKAVGRPTSFRPGNGPLMLPMVEAKDLNELAAVKAVPTAIERDAIWLARQGLGLFKACHVSRR